MLVDNRTSLALQLNTQKLPEDPAEEKAELTQLGQLAHMSLRKMRRTIAEQEEVAAGAPVTLRKDVGYDLVYYLEENQRRFPGVTVQRVFVRDYPDASRAAHVVGSVGEVSEEELKEPAYKDLEPGDEVGKGGVEYTYDKYLRGEPGLTKIQVNALGQPTPGGQLVSEPPAPGRQPEADDRPRRAGGRRKRARLAWPARRLRDDERPQRPAARARVLPDLRPDGLHRTDDPGPGRRPLPRPGDGAPDRSRDRKLLPDGIDLQARHRPGGPGRERDHALDDDLRRRQADGRHPELPERRRRLLRAADPGPRPGSVLRRLLLRTRAGTCGTPTSCSTGRHKLGIGKESGLDLPGETEGLVPSKKWRDELYAEG